MKFLFIAASLLIVSSMTGRVKAAAPTCSPACTDPAICVADAVTAGKTACGLTNKCDPAAPACKNSGTCKDAKADLSSQTADSHYCVCTAGYEGPDCSVAVTVASSVGTASTATAAPGETTKKLHHKGAVGLQYGCASILVNIIAAIMRSKRY